MMKGRNTTYPRAAVLLAWTAGFIPSWESLQPQYKTVMRIIAER